MVIAIDGYEANTQNRVGIGRYAYEILRHMYEIYKSSSVLGLRSSMGKKKGIIQELRSKIYDPRPTFRIYLPTPPLPDMPSETSWWQYRVIPLKRFWTYIGLPLGISLDSPSSDVVFSPTHYIPHGISIPKVMAIMDVSYLHFPQLFRKKDLWQLTHGTAYSIKHSEKILTISSFSKNAIIEEYQTDPDKVIVTYPGLFMNTTNIDQIEGKAVNSYDLKKPYILSVGTLQPRKNFVKLIEAFSRIIAADKKKDLTLVIVGKKGWMYEEILAAPAKFGVAEYVKFLDFVADDDLPDLYRQAVCLALPSLYEGFGLPVLEAMAVGCPVVVSDVSSLPEIAGEAGIYVKPQDLESIMQGIRTALSESGTKNAEKRKAKGIAQAKKFTWEKAAKETLELLESVASLSSNKFIK